MENEFKLPSTVKEEVKKEAQASKTVIIETKSPVWVNNAYYAGGVRVMTDKKTADDLLKSGVIVIIEDK